jgi:hypothetical protein
MISCFFELFYVPFSDYSLLCREIALLAKDVWHIEEFQSRIKSSLSLDSLMADFDESYWARKSSIAQILRLIFDMVPSSCIDELSRILKKSCNVTVEVQVHLQWCRFARFAKSENLGEHEQ